MSTKKRRFFETKRNFSAATFRHEMVALGLIRRRRWRFPSVPWSRKGGATTHGSGEKAIWTFQVVHLKHDHWEITMNDSYFFREDFHVDFLNIYLFLKWGWNTLGPRLISCDRDPFFRRFLFSMFEVLHFGLFSKVFFTSCAESQQTISSAKFALPESWNRRLIHAAPAPPNATPR